MLGNELLKKLGSVRVGAIGILVSCLMTSPALALPPPGGGGGGGGLSDSTVVTLIRDYDIKRQEANLYLTPLDFSLMGDNISTDTGQLTFSQLDVSLPGNSGLEVAIRRHTGPRKVANPDYYGDGDFYGFGDWQLDIPTISTIVPRFGPNKGWKSDRCSSSSSYPGPIQIQTLQYFNDDYWTGAKLNIPGKGTQTILEGGFTQSRWATSPAPKRVTTDHWVLSCTGSPTTGEGFIAVSPNGTKYKLDHFQTFEDDDESGAASLYTYEVKLSATEVTDVHGNWVKYTYNSSHQPIRIYSNDGRDITINYNGQLISSVVTNGRTWTYSYSNGYLTQVTLPDGRAWSFNLSGLNDGAYEHDASFCGNFTPRTVSLTHPSGTQASFDLQKVTHGRKNVTAGISYGSGSQPIYDPCDTYDLHYVARKSRTLSVVKKTLSGTSIPTSEWDYTYSGDSGSFASDPLAIPDTKTQTVVGPENNVTVYHTDRRFGSTEGQLVKVQKYASLGGALLEETINSYNMPTAFGHPGSSPGGTQHDNIDNITRPSYTTQSVTTRDGDTFTSEYTYDTNPNSSTYSYGKPLTTKSYSNVSTSPRETVTTYEHNKTKWILGLPKTVTQNGRLLKTNSYDANTGDLLTRKLYNATVPQVTLEYNTDGTIKKITDAIGRKTEPSNWKRGTAQTILQSDGSTIEQNVDDNGWLTSRVDALLRTDSYSYDSMGRLTEIDPRGDWEKTYIGYSFPSGGGAEQTITTGQSKTSLTYDSLFRPTLERTQATDTGWSSYVNTEYDALGRVIFKSQPSLSASETKGVDTSYDALGRVLTVAENVAPYATTTHSYHNSHRHRVTDPSGAYMDYYSYGYDGPGNEDYRAMYHSSGQKTTLHKNIYGQLTRIQQWGTQPTGGAKDVSQYLYYDTDQRLCRYRTVEGGDTVYKYNLAGEMTSYQKGLSNGTTCATPTGTAKVSQTYDLMGRPKITDFTDSNTPDITRIYDANGNVKHVNRGSGGTAINWTYAYNNADLLTSEILSIDGRSFPFSYSYNTSKSLTQRTAPNSFYTEFQPDGLGRATVAKYGFTSYANNAAYHPNGALASLAYGNGQAFTQTLNNRLLPSRLLAVNGGTKALDLNYTYDARAKVSSVIDGAVSGNNRSYGYDALGRMTTASGPWGTGSANYDVLNNIASRTFSGGGFGTRTLDLQVDIKNRVYQSIDSRPTGSGGTGIRTVAYDTRGNVTTLGTMGMVYDYSDQPTVVSGTANGVGVSNGTYRYDGNLKRVKSVVNGRTIYNIYDASGALAHVLKLAYIDDQNQNVPETRSDYVKLGGMAIARVENKTTPFYSFSDHIGSAVAVWKQGGTIERERYTPFGITMDNPASLKDQAGFTGHIKDSATGLNYMQARYYDPVMGRFLSVDPVTFMDTGNPSYFNRYAYVFNDPINGADSTGMICDEGLCNKVANAIRNALPGPDNPQELVERYGQPTSDIGQRMPPAGSSLSDGSMMVTTQVFPAALAAAGAGRIGPNTTPAAAATRSAQARPQTTTVGRWMSTDEAANMQSTGMVQESRSGLTHVSNPASSTTFKNAPSGSVYTQFDVPSSSLRPSSTGSSSIPGPNAPVKPAPSMPPARNIEILDQN